MSTVCAWCGPPCADVFLQRFRCPGPMCGGPCVGGLLAGEQRSLSKERPGRCIRQRAFPTLASNALFTTACNNAEQSERESESEEHSWSFKPALTERDHRKREMWCEGSFAVRSLTRVTPDQDPYHILQTTVQLKTTSFQFVMEPSPCGPAQTALSCAGEARPTCNMFRSAISPMRT